MALSRPSGKLARHVQAIWAASLPEGVVQIVQQLHPEAGSGLIFVLDGRVQLGNKTLAPGAHVLPTLKQSQRIRLTDGAILAGIRFHPARGRQALGIEIEKSRLPPDYLNHLGLEDVSRLLIRAHRDAARTEILYGWALQNLNIDASLPRAVEHTLQAIDNNLSSATLTYCNTRSQRQIERLFQTWLTMSPKRYQRIRRCHRAITYLRNGRYTALADLALLMGFSDQAHMTREFRAIAGITPNTVPRDPKAWPQENR